MHYSEEWNPRRDLKRVRTIVSYRRPSKIVCRAKIKIAMDVLSIKESTDQAFIYLFIFILNVVLLQVYLKRGTLLSQNPPVSFWRRTRTSKVGHICKKHRNSFFLARVSRDPQWKRGVTEHTLTGCGYDDVSDLSVLPQLLLRRVSVWDCDCGVTWERGNKGLTSGGTLSLCILPHP